MAALALANSTYSPEAETPCSFFFLLPGPFILTFGFVSSERLEPETPPQAPSRHGRTAPRNTSASQQNVSRTSAPHRTTSSIRQRPTRQRIAAVGEDEVVVDAIFSAHSDGLMVILRHASSVPSPVAGQSTRSASTATSTSTPTATAPTASSRPR